MDFKEYQEKAHSTAQYDVVSLDSAPIEVDAVGTGVVECKEIPFVYPMLGLAGEAGELCNKLKKVIRDHNDFKSDEYKEDMAKELGDCL